jgi:putative ABC transport system substrate-binding protein
MAAAVDPVAERFVDSLSKPGHNVTGLSLITSTMAQKAVQLLMEAVPSSEARVGILWNPADAVGAAIYPMAEAGVRRLGPKVQSMEARDAATLERSFEVAAKAHTNRLVVLASGLTLQYRGRIVELANAHKMAAIYPFIEFVQAGGLMSYGADLKEVWRRAATYVDKILKGAKPSEMPVEQPSRFVLAVNTQTAKRLGIALPPSILLRADQLIQ